jgi:hypothetical protein
MPKATLYHLTGGPPVFDRAKQIKPHLLLALGSPDPDQSADVPTRCNSFSISCAGSGLLYQ